MVSMFSTIGSLDAVLSIKKFNGKQVYEFSANLAAAYRLDNGKFIIIPENDDSALLFNDKNDFDNFLKHPEFPEPKRQPYFYYRNEIKNLDQNFSFFVEAINKELNTEFRKIDSKEDIKTVFDSLSLYIQNDNDFYFKIFVPLGLLIGNYLKIKENLKWEFSTVYAFQPYIIPILRDDQNQELPIWSILEDCYEDKNFDFYSFTRRVKI